MRIQNLWGLAALLSIVDCLPLTERDESSVAPPVLRFKQDGTFHISVFNDLHYGEGEDNPPEVGWGPVSDLKTTRVINTILDTERPDFSVLNGDLITGENTYIHNSTQYLDQIIAPLVSRGIPWGSTYGNHDNDFNISTVDLYKRERAMWPSLSVTRSMLQSEAAGTSNYYVPVYGSKSGGEEGKEAPRLLLWFFDSKGGKKFQEVDEKGNRVQIPGVVDPSVANWFLKTNNELTSHYGRVIPSLAFVHIPVYAMTEFQAQGVNPNQEPGINEDNPLAPQGVTDGKYTGADAPFMTALLRTKGLMGVFSGHDHGDDWCFNWNKILPAERKTAKPIFLCFGRHTGHGGYGQWTRGSRQVLLREDTLDQEFETWTRLEDEVVSGRTTLNETYGTDQYPAVDITYS